MERYEHIAVVGEGSYGVVLKCRHRDTDQVVAIKKFLETEEDPGARKMALREIRMLKKLKHENLITMIEVFRHRKRFYLVFEYLQGTVLDEIEKHSNGIGEDKAREHIYQVLRAVTYCHAHHVVHRDIKPENILISALGVIKLCDFGFARVMSPSMELCTEYVATRWYRAPELLIGEQRYGSPVDIWAVGCLFAEMLTGEPLFPGESDIDQLHLIVKSIGKPCSKHQAIMSKNSQLRSIVQTSSSPAERGRLHKMFSKWSFMCEDFLNNCLRMDPQSRLSSAELMKHTYFTHDNFPQVFLPDLREKVTIEFNSNPLMRKFKAEILICTDTGKSNDDKFRRVSTHTETNARWKVNIEGNEKRKFGCDNSETSFQGRKSYREKTGLTFLKSNKLNSVQESDVQTIGKAMDKTHTKYVDSSTMTSFSFNCNRKGGRKSPTLLQSIQPSIMKSVNTSTLAAVRSTVQSIKRDHKALDSDQFMNVETVKLTPTTKSTNANRKNKKTDFTLPNLPGATTSPKDTKPNKNVSTPETNSIVTPRLLSANGSTKYILPFM